MELIAALSIPLLLAGVAVYAVCKRVDVYSALLSGAKEGLSITMRILPALVALLTAVYMFRVSGAMDFFVTLLSPLLKLLGIPPETAALVLIRPLSGSGALAVGSEIISKYGADSLIGRTAAVMLGSTETTFYVVAVYFGAVGVKKTRWAIPAALCADAVGFIAAAFFSHLLFS